MTLSQYAPLLGNEAIVGNASGVGAYRSMEGERYFLYMYKCLLAYCSVESERYLRNSTRLLAPL